MGIEQYISAREQMQRRNDTLTHELYTAALGLNEELRDQSGLIDRRGFAIEPNRKEAAEKFRQRLQQVAKDYIKSAADDELSLFQLTGAFFGNVPTNTPDYLEQQQGNFDFSKFMQFAVNDNVMQFFLRRNIDEYPKQYLEESDANAVIRLTGTEGRVDPLRLNTDEMAELINQYLENGRSPVTDAFLHGKRYANKSRLVLPS